MEGEPEIDPESESDFCVSEEEEQNDDMVEIGDNYFIYYVCENLSSRSSLALRFLLVSPWQMSNKLNHSFSFYWHSVPIKSVICMVLVHKSTPHLYSCCPYFFIIHGSHGHNSIFQVSPPLCHSIKLAVFFTHSY